MKKKKNQNLQTMEHWSGLCNTNCTWGDWNHGSTQQTSLPCCSPKCFIFGRYFLYIQIFRGAFYCYVNQSPVYCRGLIYVSFLGCLVLQVWPPRVSPIASQQMNHLLFFSFELESTWQAQPKSFLSVHIQISIDRCQNNLPVVLIPLFANLE